MKKKNQIKLFQTMSILRFVGTIALKFCFHITHYFPSFPIPPPLLFSTIPYSFFHQFLRFILCTLLKLITYYSTFTITYCSWVGILSTHLSTLILTAVKKLDTIYLGHPVKLRHSWDTQHILRHLEYRPCCFD